MNPAMIDFVVDEIQKNNNPFIEFSDKKSYKIIKMILYSDNVRVKNILIDYLNDNKNDFNFNEVSRVNTVPDKLYSARNGYLCTINKKKTLLPKDNKLSYYHLIYDYDTRKFIKDPIYEKNRKYYKELVKEGKMLFEDVPEEYKIFMRQQAVSLTRIITTEELVNVNTK